MYSQDMKGIEMRNRNMDTFISSHIDLNFISCYEGEAVPVTSRDDHPHIANVASQLSYDLPPYYSFDRSYGYYELPLDSVKAHIKFHASGPTMYEEVI